MSSNNNQPKMTSNNNQPNMDPAKVGFRVPQMYVALPWQATRLSSLNPEMILWIFPLICLPEN